MKTKVLDLSRDYRMLGPKEGERGEKGEAYALQDGMIFGWSESNVQYETVWWLDSEGERLVMEVFTDDSPEETARVAAWQAHVDKMCQERPFDPAWLKEGVDGQAAQK